MKKLATKLFALIFIVILAAGCASSLTGPQELNAEQETDQIEAPAPGDIESRSDMRADREKPM